MKLESPTLADEPMMLLRTIGRLALAERARDAALVPAAGAASRAHGAAAQPMASSARTSGDRGGVPTALRERAEARVATALAWKPLRRFVFGWVLRQARLRVRNRENLRFERTRVFGRVRRIFVEAGKRLVAEGRLERADDVFYLQVDEVLGFVEGTVTTASLGALAEARRREFDGYRALEAPADRFDTHGAVWVGNRFQQTRAVAALGDDERRGIGCCPGVVEGRARVITDPRGASLEPGDILVAERTDPGLDPALPVGVGGGGRAGQRALALGHRGARAGIAGGGVAARSYGVAARRRLDCGGRHERRGAPGRARGRECWPERKSKSKPERKPKPKPKPERIMSVPSSGPATTSAPSSARPRVASHADFSAVRYAQCWEDADVLVEALAAAARSHAAVDRVGRRQHAGAAHWPHPRGSSPST